MAVTATSRLPKAVITTIGIGPASCASRRIADRPSMPGSRTSSTTRSGAPFDRRFECLFGRRRHAHFVARLGQQPLQSPANAFFVVDDQHVAHAVSLQQSFPAVRLDRATSASAARRRSIAPEERPAARLRNRWVVRQCSGSCRRVTRRFSWPPPAPGRSPRACRWRRARRAARPAAPAGPGPLSLIRAPARGRARADQFDPHPAAWSGGFDGVEHQVQEQLPQVIGVGPQLGAVRPGGVDSQHRRCDDGSVGRDQRRDVRRRSAAGRSRSRRGAVGWPAVRNRCKCDSVIVSCRSATARLS